AVADHLAALAMSMPRQQGRLAWNEAPRLGMLVDDISQSMHELAACLQAAGEDSPLSSVAERVAGLAMVLGRFAAVDVLEGTRAVEVTQKGFTLSLIPFDVAKRFQLLLQSRPTAWIFTSATLSFGEDFTPFTSRLGLGDAGTLKIDSPFDYERQSILYLP